MIEEPKRRDICFYSETGDECRRDRAFIDSEYKSMYEFCKLSCKFKKYKTKAVGDMMGKSEHKNIGYYNY